MEKYIVKGNEILIEFLKKMFSNLSKNSVKSLLHNEKVFVNGNMTTKYNYELNIGDVVEIREKVAKNIDIIYEDKDIIVINKPSGLLTVATEKEKNKTAYHLVMEYLKKKNKNNRIFIIHRLDKDTSGILVIAKNDEAHNKLAVQFKDHSIKREYYALVEGKFSSTTGTINKPLGRDKKDRIKMAINEDGKRAVTHYEVLEQYDKGISLVKCTLETGRTHQIRVHMASIGHPLVGDLVYGYKRQKFNVEGQVLHAKTLGFIHPRTNEYMEFTSELPEYFKELLNKLNS